MPITTDNYTVTFDFLIGQLYPVTPQKASSPKRLNVWQFLQQKFLQPKCPSCLPTNSIKELTIKVSTNNVMISFSYATDVNHVLKTPFTATQLNSTRRQVELSCELSRFEHFYDVQLS